MNRLEWYQRFVDDHCLGDENHILIKEKPTPIQWPKYYLQCLKLDNEKGRFIARKWVEETIKVMGGEEGLTALQELVLDGDIHTAEYQLTRLIEKYPSDEEEKKPIYEREKSVLHYAVLKRKKRMVEMLINTPGGYKKAVNQKDIITGFTPLHIAFFVQDEEIIWFLLQNRASLDIEDNFEATITDYLRLLGNLPHPNDKLRETMKIKVFNKDKSEIEEWSIEKFDSEFNVRWSPRYYISTEYLEELMFSGFQVGEKDETFRKNYLDKILKSTGDENIVICYIDEKVGWGAYAGRDFKKDEYIITYTGQFINKSLQKDRSYSMQSGLEGIILDSKYYRNLASFINHSENSNVESTCIFHKGIELAVILATRDIEKGEQLLLNYGEMYFKKNDAEFTKFDGEKGDFPLKINI